MKRKKSIFRNLLLISLTSVLLFSCGYLEMALPDFKGNNPEKIKINQTRNYPYYDDFIDFTADCGRKYYARLSAAKDGKGFYAGEVFIYNDEEFLHVEIEMQPEWFLRNSFLYVGEKSETKKIKNPERGNFPEATIYHAEIDVPLDHYHFYIDTKKIKNWGEFDVALFADMVEVQNEYGNPILDNDGLATVTRTQSSWANNYYSSNFHFNPLINSATYFRHTFWDCDNSCVGTWIKTFELVNNTPGKTTFDFDEFDLMEGKNIVAKVKFRKEKYTNEKGDEEKQLIAEFELVCSDYIFIKSAFIESEYDDLGDYWFDPVFWMWTNDPSGGSFGADYFDDGKLYIGVYAEIVGPCRLE